MRRFIMLGGLVRLRVCPEPRNAPVSTPQTKSFLHIGFVSVMQKWQRNILGGHRDPFSPPSSEAMLGNPSVLEA